MKVITNKNENEEITSYDIKELNKDELFEIKWGIIGSIEKEKEGVKVYKEIIEKYDLENDEKAIESFGTKEYLTQRIKDKNNTIAKLNYINNKLKIK